MSGTRTQNAAGHAGRRRIESRARLGDTGHIRRVRLVDRYVRSFLPTRNGSRTVLAGCAATALLWLCAAPGTASSAGDVRPVAGERPNHDPVQVGILTSASGHHFEYSGTARRVTARGPAGSDDGNLREVFWRPKADPHRDQEVCTVWDDTADSSGSPDGNRQMGLALRIAPATGDGRGIKAITLTQNVYGGATWMFWVDVWNVTDPARPDFDGVKQFDLHSIVGSSDHAVPPPWHVCARVQGLTFRFKIWSATEVEPTWHDATHVFTATLPNGWNYPGHAGGYVGHLHSSQTASFSDLATRPLPARSTPSEPSRSGSPGGTDPVARSVLGWPTYVG